MKCRNALIALTLALSLSPFADAVPVQYQLTANYFAEYASEEKLATVTPLFSADALLSITFFYDTATPATSVNNQPSLISALGPNSYYKNAMTNISGVIQGYSLQAAGGDVIVSDATGTDSSIFDGVSLVLGSQLPNSNFQGLSVGDYTLKSLKTSIAGDYSMLSSQALPTSLACLISGSGSTQLVMTFKNSAADTRTLAFSNINITAVPLPGAAVFFVSGLVGLGANTFRRQKQ